MAQKHQWTGARVCNVHADAVGFEEAVIDLGHWASPSEFLRYIVPTGEAIRHRYRMEIHFWRFEQSVTIDSVAFLLRLEASPDE